MNTEQIQRLLEIQGRAVTILRSIKNTSDLNFSHLQDRSIKIPVSIVNQIRQVLLELDNFSA